jgi:hypothetical protein
MAKSFAAQLADALETSWPAIARANQLPPPGDWWQIWLLLAGRGFGKTRTLAEWVCQQARCRTHDRSYPPGLLRLKQSESGPDSRMNARNFQKIEVSSSTNCHRYRPLRNFVL